MTARLKKPLTIVSLAFFAIVISYVYLDRPIAFWVNDHVSYHYLLNLATKLPNIAIFFSLSYIPIYALKVSCKAIRPYDKPLLNLTVAIGLTFFLKSFLKDIFGRTWPNTWIDGNPSLINDGVFGFNFFHTGAAFQSFPSGHTAIMMATMTVLWFEYPKLRPIAVFLSSLLFISQLLLNYHFFSDLLAGSLLGMLVSYFVVKATVNLNNS